MQEGNAALAELPKEYRSDVRRYKIVEFINDKTSMKEGFTANQIVSATGVKLKSANEFLRKLLREKNLSRKMQGRHYLYKQEKPVHLTSVPKGMITDCVWEIFQRSEVPLAMKELYRIVEAALLINGVMNFSENAIYKIVSIFYDEGCLIKFGTGKLFQKVEYLLKDEWRNSKRPSINGDKRIKGVATAQN